MPCHTISQASWPVLVFVLVLALVLAFVLVLFMFVSAVFVFLSRIRIARIISIRFICIPSFFSYLYHCSYYSHYSYA